MFWSLFFIYLFLIITFGYSAFEKVTDFRGSITYYKNYFNGIFISKWMSLILMLIIVAEMVTTLLLCAGVYELWIVNQPIYGLYGIITASSILLCFLFGQRLVKDYEGARGIAIYFIICIVGFLVMSFES